MNYPFRSAVLGFLRGGSARSAADSILRICENYPAPALHVLMNFISTHDTERAITALAGESCEGKDRYWQSGRRLSPERYEHGRRLVCMAYAMLFTLQMCIRDRAIDAEGLFVIIWFISASSFSARLNIYS